MKTPFIKVKILKSKLNKVELEILPEKKQISVPRRVFNKRLDTGFYEVTNPSELPSVI